MCTLAYLGHPPSQSSVPRRSNVGREHTMFNVASLDPPPDPTVALSHAVALSIVVLLGYRGCHGCGICHAWLCMRHVIASREALLQLSSLHAHARAQERAHVHEHEQVPVEPLRLSPL